MNTTQQRKKSWCLPALLAFAVGCLISSRTEAVLSVTNGDFELNTTQTNDVAAWFDTVGANPANWWESTWAGPAVSPNGTSVLGLSFFNTVPNWAYQSIGINDEAKDSIIIRFDHGSFTDAGGQRTCGLKFSIYESDGTYAGGSNTVDIAGAPGVWLVDEVEFIPAVPLESGEMRTDQAVELSLFDSTTTGELFLRIQNVAGGFGEPWTAVDNIVITDGFPPFEPFVFTPANGATDVGNPVMLEVEITDWGSTFDSVDLTFDGAVVTPDSVVSGGGVTLVSYDPGLLAAGSVHTGKVIAAGINPSASLTNQWIFTMQQSLSFVSGSPSGPGASELPVIEAVIADGDSELDLSSLELYLDDMQLTPVDYNTVNGTTTVFYATGNYLDPGSTHTGKVVYAGINPVSGPFTNSWIFSVSGDPGYGVYITTDTNAPTPDAYDIYQFEAPLSYADNIDGVDGNPYVNDGSTYVAHDRDAAQGQLFTTENTAPAYILNSVWVKHAGYTNTPTWADVQVGDVMTLRIVQPAGGDSLDIIHSELMTVMTNSLVSAGGAGTGYWVEFRLQSPVTLSAGTQYGFDLSSPPPGGFDTFFELSGVKTDPYDGGTAYTTTRDGTTLGTVHATDDRTFLLDLEPGSGGGPTVTPNIQSIIMSGGTAMLIWDSETGVSYSVYNKTSLTSAGWTVVTNGIPGAEASTSVSVPAVSDQEFFQVQGQ